MGRQGERRNPARPARRREAPRGARRPRGLAREALLEAAAAEFNEAGFDGTDTNRIARRAGYAPQTFYRHFEDKISVFVEVYRRWTQEEFRQLGAATARGPSAAARVVLDHHGTHRGFRRSLRTLAVVDPTMRAARAENRRRQLEALGRGPWASLDRPSRIGLLLCVERIADAAADGELHDLGLSRAAATRLLARTIERLSEGGADRVGRPRKP